MAITKVASTLASYRRSFRYEMVARVDIMRDGAAVGAGYISDISRDGAAFLCYAPLPVGITCVVAIEGFPPINGTIVRRFRGDHYGVQFHATESTKRRIDAKILAEITGE